MTFALLELRSQSITDLNSQIIQMRQLTEDQRIEIEVLKAWLEKAYGNMAVIQNLYEEQREKNDDLVKQWRLRFANQAKRIDAIIEIAKAERMSIYDDVESLIRDNNRFSIENLMAYTPSEWLHKRNQVVVKFLENDYDADATMSQEKLFKTAVAVDLIYGARHGKYVSEVHLSDTQLHNRSILIIILRVREATIDFRPGWKNYHHTKNRYLKDFYFLHLTMNRRDKKTISIVDLIS